MNGPGVVCRDMIGDPFDSIVQLMVQDRWGHCIDRQNRPRDICDTKCLRRDICDNKSLRRDICDNKSLRRDICDNKSLRRDICETKSLRRDICETKSLRRDICDTKSLRRDICDNKSLRRDICDTKSLRRRQLRNQAPLAMCKHLYVVLGTSIHLPSPMGTEEAKTCTVDRLKHEP
ncbi:hypothetical protein N7478_010511 [Penicillium angulare]|uniref:uncharacterized protein n=1 Tax=Penicillium angulare TaxID=116970 RepID=UPI0025421F2F|nr:uncharacterized protein N7478_010511 [Penicillium angulare]KAJ5267703.1 hypothetical protein N7478_010511 [Penicillium angulare]